MQFRSEMVVALVVSAFTATSAVAQGAQVNLVKPHEMAATVEQLIERDAKAALASKTAQSASRTDAGVKAKPAAPLDPVIEVDFIAGPTDDLVALVRVDGAPFQVRTGDRLGKDLRVHAIQAGCVVVLKDYVKPKAVVQRSVGTRRSKEAMSITVKAAGQHWCFKEVDASVLASRTAETLSGGMALGVPKLSPVPPLPPAPPSSHTP